MKSIIYFSAIGFMFLMSCGHAEKANKTNLYSNSIKLDTNKADITEPLTLGSEYLNWKTIKINGKVYTISKSNVFYKALGKPDSVIEAPSQPECGTFFFPPFKYVYIKGATFQLKNDSLVLYSLTFKKNGLTLNTNKLILSNNTTLESINKIFPFAVKKQTIDSTLDHKKVIVININATPPHVSADYGTWELTFQNGKLIEIFLGGGC